MLNVALVLFPLLSGQFDCQGQRGGAPVEVCPQTVKVTTYSGGFKGLSVTHGGDCAGDGPYSYFCDGLSCISGELTILVKDATHYNWENSTYGITATCARRR